MEKSRKIDQLEIELERAKQSLTNSEKDKERLNRHISSVEEEKNRAQERLNQIEKNDLIIPCASNVPFSSEYS